MTDNFIPPDNPPSPFSFGSRRLGQQPMVERISSEAELHAPQDQRAHSGNILLYLPWEFDMLGGVDVVVDRLWRGLEQHFPGLATIGIQDWSFQGEKIDAEGRRFLHLNLPAPPGNSDKLPFRYLATLARRLPILLRTLKNKGITTVNAHFPAKNTYPLALLKRAGLWRGQIILSFHGSDVADIDPTSAQWMTIASQTNAITACSAALAKRIEEIGVFRQPVQVIYNGIDREHFLQKIGTFSPEANSPYILNVGNYVPGKAQDVLLKAFAKIASLHPDLKLICVGGTGNGQWLENLKSLAKRLNVADRVILLENQSQENVACLMKHALCLAHTPHNEAFGLVLIEAAVCSTPIIASRVGGIPEIISSDEFGLLFNDGDVDTLAKNLCLAIDKPDVARLRASRLLERVKESFSIEAMLQGYTHTFQLTPT